MSILKVGSIQLNQEGNAIVSIANSYNVSISVDGSEKVKVHSSGVNINTGGSLTVNNKIVIDSSGKLSDIPVPGTTGNVLTSNGSSWVSLGTAANVAFNDISANNIVTTQVNASQISATTFIGSGSQLTGVGFLTGTVMLFGQTAAPTGWTKMTTHDDKALRIVSGSVSSGGTVAFTTAFASKAVSGSLDSVNVTGSIGNKVITGTIGATTLATSQIPSHSHTIAIASLGPSGGGGTYVGGGGTYTTSSTGGGGSHTHTFTADTHNHTFSGGAHSHTFTGTAIDLAVQYVDVIMATKD